MLLASFLHRKIFDNYNFSVTSQIYEIILKWYEMAEREEARLGALSVQMLHLIRSQIVLQTFSGLVEYLSQAPALLIDDLAKLH